MPQALPLALREQVVRRHQQGEALTQIAAALQVPYRTVRRWWHRYQQAGPEGLHTHSSRCGPKAPKAPPAVHAAALALKREHPSWGAGLIRLQLVEQFAASQVPQARALQRWFRAAGLQPARGKRPPVEKSRGQAAHQVWQMDAKEQMRLGDGTGTSVLSVTEEATGAVLGLAPFPPLSLAAREHRRGAGGVALPL
jgi:transposase